MQNTFVKTGDVNTKQRTVCNAKNMIFNKFILIAKPLHLIISAKKENIHIY